MWNWKYILKRQKYDLCDIFSWWFCGVIISIFSLGKEGGKRRRTREEMNGHWRKASTSVFVRTVIGIPQRGSLAVLPASKDALRTAHGRELTDYESSDTPFFEWHFYMAHFLRHVKPVCNNRAVGVLLCFPIHRLEEPQCQVNSKKKGKFCHLSLQ